MRAVIFANGMMQTWPDGLSVSETEDLIIAADGGLHHCRRWGLVPHLVVGDMDSVEPEALAGLDADRVEIIRHPRRKDATDLELAIGMAAERGADDIVVLGALGARWDMTFANVLLLCAETGDRIRLGIMDGFNEFYCLKGNGEIFLTGRPGDLVSLMPVDGDAAGITLEGLEYPLSNARLGMGSTRGVSNVFTGTSARVALISGALLIVVTRGEG